MVFRHPRLRSPLFALVTLGCGLLVAPAAPAQTTKSLFEEYDHTIKAAQTITAFGPELFGEAVNLKDGTTTFSATDVSLRTNSGLPVAIVRSLGINSRDIDQYVNAAADGELLGNWQLEVPHLSGIYSQTTGWVSRMPNPLQRCSVTSWSAAGPPAVVYAAWNKPYFPEDYWSGDRVSIPGKGQFPLLYLPPDRSRPSDGRTYFWTTKSDWRVSCLPTIKNGTGEGYLVVLPDGTRYTFDWLSSRKVASLKDTNCTVNWGCTGETIVVNRREYFLAATKVEDRFGNWVTYTYDPANPRRLTAITSNDGVAISLTYGSHGKVSTITSGGRTWSYQYTSADGGILAAVVQPDGSRWTYQYGDLYGLLHYNNQKILWLDCEPHVPGLATATVTIGHPSGALGLFTFKNSMHGTDRTPGGCYQPDPDKPLQMQISKTPMVYKAASLMSKQISGPGITPLTWTYAYQPSWSWNPTGYSDDCTWAGADCTKTSATEVTGPDGTVTRSVFGNDYFRTAGQLQSVEVRSGGTTVQTTTYAYLPDAVGQIFPDRLGWDPNGRSNRLETEKLRPQRLTTITRDGASFHSEVELCGAGTYCFDTFARATKIRKHSSLGFSKTEETTYQDFLGPWVLGQTATTVVNGIQVSRTDYHATTALPTANYQFAKQVESLQHNADGTLRSITDGNGQVTTVSDWKRGIPRLIQYPATPEAPTGATESAVVDDRGWITAVTDENGYTTTYGYDVMGRLASIDPPSGDTVAWQRTTIAFELVPFAEHGLSAGHWRAVRRQGPNAHTNTYYDALWRPVLEERLDATNIAGTLTQVVKRYDSSGRLAFQSYPTRNVGDFGAVTQGVRTFYDALDRPVRVEQDSELGVLSTTTAYLPGFQTRVTNPRGFPTTTSFLAWDQPSYDLPIQSLQPEDKRIDIDRHPHLGRPTALTQRNGSGGLAVTRRYVYDGHGQLCKTIEPETGATVTGYDGANNPTWTASGLTGGDYANAADCSHLAAWSSGRRSDRSYDGRNRLRTLRFPNGVGDLAWTYEKDGLPASVTAYNGSGNTTPVITTYSYNRRRLLTHETLGQPGWYTWSIGYSYDPNGHLATLTYPTGLTLDYAPNALGQATRAGSYATGVTYHPNGAIASFTYGNGLVHTMAQNARQLPFEVQSSGGVLYDQYGYDPNGNVDHIYDLLQGPVYSVRSRWMTYDGLDRLTGAGAGMFGGTDNWHRFTFDALDNLKSWRLAGVKDYASYVYDANHRLTTITNTAGATEVSLTYDAQGNLANKNGQNYLFDFGNRLREVSGKEHYRYDGLGRRALAWHPTLGSILSHYNQAGQLLYQHDERAGKTEEHIYLGGSIVATRELAIAANTHATKYQHTDALGSPVAVTDQLGTVIDRNDYDPFGAIHRKPTKNGLGYTGHVMDGATGLIYMQQRYYDPAIGRFLSVDPVTADPKTGAMFNRYAYANNNPYRFTDPDGRCPKGITRSCLSSSVPGKTTTNVVVTPAAEAALKRGKKDFMVPKPGTRRAGSRGQGETLGSIRRQDDGSLKARVNRNAETSQFSASMDADSKDEVIVHGHSSASGLRDEKLSDNPLGDAAPLLDGRANIAVGADGRAVAHEIVNGTYQVRALDGAEFNDAEIKYFQGVLDSRQILIDQALAPKKP
ncbi:MAG: RHS repeat-associated core domain-containing protein [Thermoanaerobaculia bacterium]|nr:RHS repeat-associated core domain-containing protein [Thermoanaerobaculia bacterium]